MKWNENFGLFFMLLRQVPLSQVLYFTLRIILVSEQLRFSNRQNENESNDECDGRAKSRQQKRYDMSMHWRCKSGLALHVIAAKLSWSEQA